MLLECKTVLVNISPCHPFNGTQLNSVSIADIIQFPVTRCAVSPLFPALFIDQTRKDVIGAFTAEDKTLRNMGTCPPGKVVGEDDRTCQTCGIVGKAKICARCEG